MIVIALSITLGEITPPNTNHYAMLLFIFKKLLATYSMVQKQPHNISLFEIQHQSQDMHLHLDPKAQKYFKSELAQPPNSLCDKEFPKMSWPIGLIGGCLKYYQLLKSFFG